MSTNPPRFGERADGVDVLLEETGTGACLAEQLGWAVGVDPQSDARHQHRSPWPVVEVVRERRRDLLGIKVDAVEAPPARRRGGRDRGARLLGKLSPR
jgi:hypothetical protein